MGNVKITIVSLILYSPKKNFVDSMYLVQVDFVAVSVSTSALYLLGTESSPQIRAVCNNKVFEGGAVLRICGHKAEGVGWVRAKGHDLC